ncbi:SDR family NAD(P)-dependent oxidoreductase [Marinomonas colpomeniae]|uniref:SDR family NAD(P)-dependent oxidoreductase n=1 Tax=Marinomonas colpomeniae TaxID=2774408 RepID=A0ABR8NZ20_9GAMM|nr:SDR family NAD(P)-dependent oxidoreductase [Marinomonas colpomeniae]MBD5771293.1 SDR family NAD(P)-dependent oxidoreductase [Marinomonas colpomeniae]
MKKDVVLITGASAGLGLEIARKVIASKKYCVVLTARPNSIERFADEGIVESDDILLRPLDITSADMRCELINEINEHHDGVDILINNAGFTFRAVVEDVSEEDRLMQMNTNFRSPMELTRLCLPSMRHKRKGKIINISSMGGQMAMPTMAVYSASKYALEGATESLWYELKPWNIKVTLVQPGFINSKGFEKVKKTELSKLSSEETQSPYYQHYVNMENFIEKIMRLTPSTSHTVARKVLKVMKANNPPLRVAGTIDAVFFKLMKTFVPQRIYHWILYRCLPNIDKWGK